MAYSCTHSTTRAIRGSLAEVMRNPADSPIRFAMRVERLAFLTGSVKPPGRMVRFVPC